MGLSDERMNRMKPPVGGCIVMIAASRGGRTVPIYQIQIVEADYLTGGEGTHMNMR